MTGHLRLRVVRLSFHEISKVGQIIAVVDEPGDELRLVLEDKDGGVVAVGRDAAHERRVEDQLDLPGKYRGAAVSLLTLPADLGHQPRQHGQSGPPVQRRPADVTQPEPLLRLGRAILLLLGALHVDHGHSEYFCGSKNRFLLKRVATIASPAGCSTSQA